MGQACLVKLNGILQAPHGSFLFAYPSGAVDLHKDTTVLLRTVLTRTGATAGGRCLPRTTGSTRASAERLAARLLQVFIAILEDVEKPGRMLRDKMVTCFHMFSQVKRATWNWCSWVRP